MLRTTLGIRCCCSHFIEEETGPERLSQPPQVTQRAGGLEEGFRRGQGGLSVLKRSWVWGPVCPAHRDVSSESGISSEAQRHLKNLRNEEGMNGSQSDHTPLAGVLLPLCSRAKFVVRTSSPCKRDPGVKRDQKETTASDREDPAEPAHGGARAPPGGDV